MDPRTVALSTGLITVVIALAATLGILLFAMPRMFGAWQNVWSSEATIRDGQTAEGRILSASQTGLLLNQVPQMLLIVRVGERELKIKQFIDLGNMPRAGERVRLLIDPRDVNHAAYIGPILAD